MTVGLHGIGIGILALVIIALWIIGFVVTGIMVIAEKSEKQIPFRELKASVFFMANICTGLFDIVLIYVLSKMESAIVFFDKNYLSVIAMLAIYILPFRYFIKHLKKQAERK